MKQNPGICNRLSCKWHAGPTEANSCDYCYLHIIAGDELCMRGCEPGKKCTKYERGTRLSAREIKSQQSKKLSDKNLKKFLAEGYSDTAIAKMYHMNSGTVKRRREKLGIPRNHTKTIKGKITQITDKEKDTNDVT